MGELKVEGLVKGTELTYDLINIHFHSGSEHRVNGNRYTMEMHMVHQIVNKSNDMSRDKLVIGIFFDCKDNNGKYPVNNREG